MTLLNTTSTGSTVTVRLFLDYDFNTPPDVEDGLYRVWPMPFLMDAFHMGDEVVFGCKDDEIEAVGVVRGWETPPFGSRRPFLLVERIGEFRVGPFEVIP